MGRRAKELLTILAAMTALFGSILELTKELKNQEADQHHARDNFADYTVPEIEKLKDRVLLLEKTCQGNKP